MTKKITLSRRVSTLAGAALLVAASLVPVLQSTPAAAAQLTQRKITLGTSKISTSSTYAVSVQPATTTAILGIVVEICMNSPLVGASCTTASGVTGSPTTGTVTVSQTGGTPASVTFAVDGSSTAAGKLVLTHATGFTAPITTAPITFTYTAVNPSTTGSYYARILTYNTTAGAIAYTSATPGTHIDDGAVALSTAQQITVNAIVQERLDFCVGTTALVDASGAAPVDCATGFGAGTSVNLGVIDSSTASASPVPLANGGNNLNGAAMVRTNAVNGVGVTYFAEQDASTGTNKGALKVATANCVSSVSVVDQCFNSAGTTQVAINSTTSGEKFGMTISHVNRTSSVAATANLIRDLAYDGNGTVNAACTAATVDSPCWAWDDSGTAQTIASSSTVVDDEMLLLRFGAVSGVTTPTGSYRVNSTYIATATF